MKDEYMENTDNMLYEMIRETGNPVLIHTKDCIIWQNEHLNCFGCPGNIGCDKLLLMKMLLTQSLLYSPKNFQDFLEMNKHINKMMKKILGAENREALDNIAKNL